MKVSKRLTVVTFSTLLWNQNDSLISETNGFIQEKRQTQTFPPLESKLKPSVEAKRLISSSY